MQPKKTPDPFWLAFFFGVVLALVTVSDHSLCLADSARNSRGMVATVHPLATEAGVAALRRGGNAIDAAVAAALTLAVVDTHNSGIGGGCFILLRRPDGTFAAIDGRETAPAKATRDMYLRDGKAHGELSTTGPLAVATPGSLAAYDKVLKEHGRLKIADLLTPAAEIAEQGFPIDRIFAGNIKSNQAAIAKFPASRALLLRSDGTPLEPGNVLKQPDLADTYRSIAEHGISWFYQGPLAESVGKWMAENGGLLAASDFAAYQPHTRQPLVTSYRGFKIVGFPPPSSGGVHVAQILNVLEAFDLREMHRRDPVQFVHVVAEAMKLAFADRAHWLGDPEFARVPRGLIDRDYAAQLSKRIDITQVTKVERHGNPPLADTEFFGKHTTHVAAVDAEGYWVGITATINTSFGSKVVVPGTGVVLNNQMDDFSIQPGVPNAFGLVGAEANAIAPGKRPLSSMSPTIVLRDDRPILTIGAAGGPTIINQVVLGIVRHLDLEMPLEQAVALPRFHHQWTPDVLAIERSFPAEMLDRLTERGHSSKRRDTIGVTQAIGLADEGKVFVGVHDPRVPGKAGGP